MCIRDSIHTVGSFHTKLVLFIDNHIRGALLLTPHSILVPQLWLVHNSPAVSYTHLLFDFTGITKGKKVAVHPLAKPAIQNGIATDEKSEIDGNFFTAQDENTIWTMLPKVIEALK